MKGRVQLRLNCRYFFIPCTGVIVPRRGGGLSLLKGDREKEPVPPLYVWGTISLLSGVCRRGCLYSNPPPPL